MYLHCRIEAQFLYNSPFLNLESIYIKLLQLIRNSPARAVARIRAFTRTPMQASSFHSYHQINPLAKNRRAYQLQGRIAYLQLFTVLSAKISSRSFIIQPTRSTRSFSCPSHFWPPDHSSQVFQHRNIQYCTTSLERSAVWSSRFIFYSTNIENHSLSSASGFAIHRPSGFPLRTKV